MGTIDKTLTMGPMAAQPILEKMADVLPPFTSSISIVTEAGGAMKAVIETYDPALIRAVTAKIAEEIQGNVSPD